MTDRPEGTTDPEATDAGATEPTEAEAEAAEAVAEAQPEAAEPAVEPGDDEVEPEPVVEPEDDTVEPESEVEPEDDEVEPEDDEVEHTTATAAATAAAPTGRRRTPGATSSVKAPTPSELAVRVNEPWSKIFVLASVAVFVGILLYGMLGGKGGFLTPIATPTPVPTATASPSVAPSPTEAASPSP
jgi:hypothetical protein